MIYLRCLDCGGISKKHIYEFKQTAEYYHPKSPRRVFVYVDKNMDRSYMNLPPFGYNWCVHDQAKLEA